jgi:excisionase family DNA binding protein
MSLQKRFKKALGPVQEVNTAVNGPRLLNLQDAARYLSAHVWAVRQMVRKRQIPYVRIGRGYLIDRLDLDRLVEKNKVGVIAA